MHDMEVINDKTESLPVNIFTELFEKLWTITNGFSIIFYRQINNSLMIDRK